MMNTAMPAFGKKDKKEKKALVYMTSTDLWFYTEKLDNFAVFSLQNNKLIRYLEITDPEALFTALGQFIQEQKIEPGKVILILSKDVYFLRDIELKKGEHREDYVRNFTDSMPFEIVFTKELVFHRKEKIVGLNRYTYQPLVVTLTKLEFDVVAMVPDFVLETIATDGDQFTLESAKTLLKEDNADIGKYNFLALEQQTGDDSEENQEDVLRIDATVPSKKKLIPLIAVLVLLLGVLGGVIWYTQQAEQALLQPSQPILELEESSMVQDVSATPSGAIEPVIAPSEYSVVVADLRDDPDQLLSLEAQLQALELKNIASGERLLAGAEDITVIFSNRVDSALRQQIVTLLTRPRVAVVTQEDQDLEVDIFINIPPDVKLYE